MYATDAATSAARPRVRSTFFIEWTSATGRFVFVWFQYVNEKHALLTVFDWRGFRETRRRGRYTKFSIGPKYFAPPKSGRIDAGEISRKSGPALEISSTIGKRIVESLFSSPMPIKRGRRPKAIPRTSCRWCAGRKNSTP